MSKLIDDIKNAERARRELARSAQPRRGADEPLSATTARAVGIVTSAETTQGRRDDNNLLLRATTPGIANGAAVSPVAVAAGGLQDRDAAGEFAATAGSLRAEIGQDAKQPAGKAAEIADLAQVRSEQLALGMTQARLIVEAAAKRRSDARAAAEQQAFAAALARSAADSLVVDAAAARVQAERDAEHAAKETAFAHAHAIAAARAKAEAAALLDESQRQAEGRRAPDGASEIASGALRSPGISIWRLSPRLTRFAGIGAALLIGIGIGDWRGRNAGTTYPGVTAPDVLNLSAAVPRDFQLRLDDKFENFDRHFVLHVPSGKY